MATTASLLSRFPKHSVVSGRVLRVTGAGAMLIVDDDVQGYIPARELAWTDVDQPRRFIREGEQITAEVIGEDTLRNRLNLSRRLVLRNPWETITRDYPVGQIYPGRVCQVVDFGAFVELEPGVVGLVHISAIPKQEGTEQPIELWVNDDVLVQVLSVEPEQRRIALSMGTVINQRDQQVSQQRYSATPAGTTIREMLGIRSDPLADITLPWCDPAGLIQHILLVDDDHEFGSSTAAWLSLLGYRTTYVASVGEARALVQQSGYSLLLLDYDLGDGTGLDLAELAVQHNPDAWKVLLSAQADRRHCQRVPHIPKLFCWSKPFFMHDFAGLLKMLTAGNCPICQRQEPPETITVELFKPGDTDQPTLMSLEKLCADELHRIVEVTGAQTGLICCIDSNRQQVKITAQAGYGLTLHEADRNKLIYSPMRDVCMRGDVIRVADMTTQPARFRRLLPLSHFKAFLGVPIRSAERDVQFGMFLFHRAVDHFTPFHEQHAMINAGFLGLQLERQHVLRTSLAAQQALLAGKLSLSMAHEVQKQIGTLVAQSELLTLRMQKLRDQQEAIDYQTLLQRGLPEIAMRMQRSLQAIGKVTERQLDFARPYTISRFNLNHLVERVVQMLKPMAHQEHLHLAYQLDPNMRDIISAPLLIQQIFLNLAFNAIQQMAEAGLRGGELLISTAYTADAPYPVRVLFVDSGLGIHAAHYARLFQHGFTTRASGTGQGLYLSRMAAEALGGQLRLLESFVGFGATFELVLPLQMQEHWHE